MRKIVYSMMLDVETFEPKVGCKVRTEDGTVITVIDRMLEKDEYLYLGKQFKPDELQKIKTVNQGLQLNGMDPMTLEEVDFMLHWNEFPDPKTPDELQRLSGFVVEKTIKYLD